MNEFLEALSRALVRLDPAEREDILSDYREHFQIGLSQGLREEQIAQKLGDPVSLAKLYTAKTAADKAGETKHPKDAFAMVGAALAYRIGKGLVVGTLYLLFVLAMIPAFLFGGTLLLGAAGSVLLAVLEFVKGFIAYGLLAAFTAVTLAAMGALSLIGLKQLWIVVISALSALAGRGLDRGEGGKEEEA